MLSGILLLLSFAFQDPSGECYVRGYVFQDTLNNTYSFTRNQDDTCWVKDSLLENKLVLFHKTRWVMIEFPDGLKGHVSFWYKWGNERAFIGAQPINIEWGYSLKG